LKIIIAFVALMLTTNHIAVASISIELPSDPGMMAVKAVVFPEAETEESWYRLYRPGGYTDQTLENFSRGDTRGILLVHSLEDIMGAAGCFTRMWNKNHPNDQRIPVQNTVEEFHTLFSNEEFVSHYAEYVLAQRYLISGSVVAFNEQGQFTLDETFSPVSFIMKVPPQCIVVTAVSDAHTEVSYAPFSKTAGAFEREKYGVQALEYADKLSSLDSLLRYPFLRPRNELNDTFDTDMNEIAFLSCTKGVSEEFSRPQVVGVLINKHLKFQQLDYGNGVRNRQYIDAAKEYAKSTGLPTIEIDQPRASLFQSEASEVIADWFGFSTDFGEDYGTAFGEDYGYYCNGKNYHYRLLSAEQTATEKTGNELVKEILSSIPPSLDFMAKKYSAEDKKNAQEKALEKAFEEIPKYREVCEILNSLKVKGQKYLMSQEQLAGYGLH
jgi:hypothetical protein